MSVSTRGYLIGYISPERVFEYIKEIYGIHGDVINQVKKEVVCPAADCTFQYVFNEHCDDINFWYFLSGRIIFYDGKDSRSLSYSYSNINPYEGIENHPEGSELYNMIKTERTYISLGCWGNSKKIIKNLLQYFDGGWLDENDCDSENFYWVEPLDGLSDNFRVYQKMVPKNFICIKGNEVDADEICRILEAIQEGEDYYYVSDFDGYAVDALEEANIVERFTGSREAELFKVINKESANKLHDRILEYYC